MTRHSSSPSDPQIRHSSIPPSHRQAPPATRLLWNLDRHNLVCFFRKYSGRDFDMPLRFRHFFAAPVLVLTATALFCGNLSLLAQNSGMELHANSKATAADVGLPAYPGATLYKDKDNDVSVDMGYTFGDSQFRLIAANYATSDSPDQVLAFYRKPLSHYGEVLECNDGKPVGKVTMTHSGLTCADDQKGDVQVNGYSARKVTSCAPATPINSASSGSISRSRIPPALAWSTFSCRRTTTRRLNRNSLLLVSHPRTALTIG